MFFIAKIFDQMAHPLNWVVVLLILSLLRSHISASRRHALTLGALLLLLAIGLQPLPDACLKQLESGFAEIPPHANLQGYAGVIVLGGALEHAYVSAAHTQPELNGAAERMTATVALWREQPALQVIFTGGEGDYFGNGVSEAARARQFFDSQGVPAQAVRYEDQSRNTYENAVFSTQLPGIDPHKPWLLLTSAWHMPRAMALFQHAGWNVTAYPVDFLTGAATPWSSYSISTSAEHWNLLLHELLGLASYHLFMKQ